MDAARATRQFWDERYAAKPAIWSGRPNPHLVEQVTGLPPGTALDVGCGEGADAIWLAQQGWDVRALDVSDVALSRAAGAARAAGVGVGVGGRITWQQADLLDWRPGDLQVDLVSSQYLHLPSTELAHLHAALRGVVRVGGTVLIVAHHPSDLRTTIRRPKEPDLFRTPEQLADQFDAQHWRVDLADAPARTAIDQDGVEVTIHDARVRAVRIA